MLPEDQSISRRDLLAGLGACVACLGLKSSPLVAAIGRSSEPHFQRTITNKERRKIDPSAVFQIETKHPYVGLTFDDGPDPRYTPSVLSLLKSYGAHATFFLIGVNAEAYPHLVEKILSDGHSIGNHTYDHPELELLPEKLVKTEIDNGATALVSAGAPDPHLFRPPKGYIDKFVDIIADKNKYKTIFWTECVEHFIDHSHSYVHGAHRLAKRAKKGSIILAHDGGHIVSRRHYSLDRSRTIKALPHLLSDLKKKELTAVDIPRLLAVSEP